MRKVSISSRYLSFLVSLIIHRFPLENFPKSQNRLAPDAYR